MKYAPLNDEHEPQKQDVETGVPPSAAKVKSFCLEVNPIAKRFPRAAKFYYPFCFLLLAVVALIVFAAEPTARSRTLGILLVVLAGLVHWYFINRIGQELTVVWTRVVLHGCVALVTIPAALSLTISEAVSVPLTHPGPIFCFFMLGYVVLLLSVLLIADLIHVVWFGISKLVPKRVRAPRSFKWFHKIKIGIVLLVATIMAIDGVVIATRDAPVKTVDVTLSKLPPELDGFRIGMVTDIHLGPTIGRSVIDRSVVTLNSMNLDVAAIVGDITDTVADRMVDAVQSLQQLRARHGKFFVTGNHEYYLPPGGVDAWVKLLSSVGVRTLRNERTSLPSNETLPSNDTAPFFYLVGVEDWTAAHDLRKALDGRDESRELVLLAHQPKQIAEASELGVGLQLSGHVHCGQLPPASLASWLSNPYYSGLHTHNGRTQIYVSCGTGYWGPVMRIAAPNEVTLVVLHSGAGAR